MKEGISVGKYQREKTKKCKHCQSDIPHKAKVCPQCRKRVKGGILKWILIIFVVCLILPTNNEESAAKVDNSIKTEKTEVHTTISVNTNTEMETANTWEETTVPIEQEVEVIETQGLTMGQKNALGSAKNYLSFTAFSYDGLIDQLEFEGYTYEDAQFAVENCDADWNEQALKSAKNYLSFTAFSYSGLIGQLEYEKFTTEQATYAADNCGADWYEQAAKSAKNYLSFSSFSRDGLISQLEYEGFTNEQAVYGVEQNGY